MAERLPVSRLRPRPRVAAEDQEAQLRVRSLPSASLGNRRNPPAPNQAVAHDLVPGRLRLATIRSCNAKGLGSFAVRNTAAIATVKTDGWRGCSAVPRDRHQPHVVGDRPAHEVLAWIHTAFCNLKGWARGGCHGLRAKHLQTCLDEFVFRFNRRRNRHAAFLSLFLQALRAKPHPCHILIKPEPSA